VDAVERDAIAPQMPRYHALLRAQEPWQRLRTAAALSAAIRTLAVAGLRMRHPGASAEELRIRLAVRLYGRAAAERLFKDRVPADAI
jgi:hypothetical protein